MGDAADYAWDAAFMADYDRADAALEAACMADDEEPECDCADRVPADLGPGDVWICRKCDAQWFGDAA